MKIQKELLVEEMAILLKDEFTAVVSKSENNITLQFFNGQKFTINIKED